MLDLERYILDLIHLSFIQVSWGKRSTIPRTHMGPEHRFWKTTFSDIGNAYLWVPNVAFRWEKTRGYNLASHHTSSAIVGGGIGG